MLLSPIITNAPPLSILSLDASQLGAGGYTYRQLSPPQTPAKPVQLRSLSNAGHVIGQRNRLEHVASTSLPSTEVVVGCLSVGLPSSAFVLDLICARDKRPTQKAVEYANVTAALKRKRRATDDDESESGDDDYVDNDPDDSSNPTGKSRSTPAAVIDVDEDDEEDPSSQEDTADAQPRRQKESRAQKDKRTFNERYDVGNSTNQEVLEKQMGQWTSEVYQHFHLPPKIIITAEKKVKYAFQCKTNPSIVVRRSRDDNSTSNLNKHIERCVPTPTSQTQTLETFAHGSTYSEAKHRVNITLWAVRRRRPFAIVADPELLQVFTDLRADCVTPKPWTVSRDAQEIHKITRESLIEWFQKFKGRLHVGADGWTSPNVISFIGATVHFAVKGKMESFVLDFIKCTKAHTGVYLAGRIAECLKAYGIDRKVLGFVCDNASNNDTLVTELKRLVPTFCGSKYRIRCFAHVINLVAKAMLAPFSGKATTTIPLEDTSALDTMLAGLEDAEGEGLFGDEDDESESELEDAGSDDEARIVEVPDDDEVAPEVASFDDDMLMEVEKAADVDVSLPALSLADAKAGQIVLTKLRKLAIKIFHSPTINEELRKACKQHNVKYRRIVRDVATRWNSTTEVIKSALDLKEPLNQLVVQTQFNKAGGVRLQRFSLDNTEWEILKQLGPMLDMLLYVTTEVSKTSVPLIHDVIPFIDSLTSWFEDYIRDIDLHPTVRHAALRGMLMMNKYYARTDEAVIFLLHPRMKANYFTRHKWPAAWITEAKEITRREWLDNYKTASSATSARNTPAAAPVDAQSDRFSKARQRVNEYRDMAPDDDEVDALEEWLSTPPVKTKLDPIKYWFKQKQDGHPLAQMALDFLSAPATSTDAERAFSRGGLTVSKLRHALSAKSVRATTVLGSWAEHDWVIPRAKLYEHFKTKKRRPKKKAKLDESIAGSNVITVE
ncbi:hypothetical protein CC1G_01006 [Coprinopsis cinerea okayama7|uniref:HAT C-terminal dimerisation domain-containing protein n=1 Tax=Coprinopsis cinerea (strain Okayama-7 / 130 / ATCC MYA-4618 / FGSC 9003) TaxID=240176 RepID=A8NE64_COPC7|nr:hypothetical protein CC1G_01006 [Coprinopsis cinerea okayama7\|eukprot:XP_001832944.2 hypothetical protein CC1G_01006 [Coprinopsis cinerea okayama7\